MRRRRKRIGRIVPAGALTKRHVLVIRNGRGDIMWTEKIHSLDYTDHGVHVNEYSFVYPTRCYNRMASVEVKNG